MYLKNGFPSVISDSSHQQSLILKKQIRKLLKDTPSYLAHGHIDWARFHNVVTLVRLQELQYIDTHSDTTRYKHVSNLTRTTISEYVAHLLLVTFFGSD